MCKRINIFFPIYIVCYILMSFLYGVFIRTTNIVPPLWIQFIVSEVILLLPPIIYILINKINVLKCLPIRKLKPVDALLSLLLGYALIPAVLLINYVTMLFSTNYMQETQSELSQYPYLIQIILIAVLPPLVEEFIFRGLFYHSYRRNGVVGAALVSGLIFGCVHMNINQFCYAFLIGIIFALLVEATGSLWSSVIAHFAVNTFSITMIKLFSIFMPSDYMEQAQEQAASMSGSPVYIVTQIVAMFFFAAIGLMIAFVIYRGIAIRNNRWGYMKNNFRMGLRPQNGEKFFNVVSIATFLAVACYMIVIELGTRYL